MADAGPEAGTAPRPPAGMVGRPGWFLTVVSDQRVAFLAVGAANTLIGLFWFTVFHVLLGERFHYLVLLAFAHVASVLCAFVLYRRVVFRVHGHVMRDLARFESVYLTAFGVNLLLLPVLVEGLGAPVLAAQLLVVALTATFSYVGHKYFSFRRPRPSHDDLPVPDEAPR